MYNVIFRLFNLDSIFRIMETSQQINVNEKKAVQLRVIKVELLTTEFTDSTKLRKKTRIFQYVLNAFKFAIAQCIHSVGNYIFLQLGSI